MAVEIVVGLFHSRGIAEDAVNRLHTEGIPDREIGLRMLRETTSVPETMEPELAALSADPMVWGNVRDTYVKYISNGETVVLVRAENPDEVELAMNVLHDVRADRRRAAGGSARASHAAVRLRRLPGQTILASRSRAISSGGVAESLQHRVAVGAEFRRRAAQLARRLGEFDRKAEHPDHRRGPGWCWVSTICWSSTCGSAKTSGSPMTRPHGTPAALSRSIQCAVVSVGEPRLDRAHSSPRGSRPADRCCRNAGRRAIRARRARRPGAGSSAPGSARSRPRRPWCGTCRRARRSHGRCRCGPAPRRWRNSWRRETPSRLIRPLLRLAPTRSPAPVWPRRTRAAHTPIAP